MGGVDLENRFLEALAAREALLQSLATEETDCVRLFHGIAEGQPGLTIDRYGPLVLVQTFREPLSESAWASLEKGLAVAVPEAPHRVYNPRGRLAPRMPPSAPEEALAPLVGRESGLSFQVRARHRGQDPLLFLDMRVGRSWVRSCAAGLTVLNAFAYTCGFGVVAAAGGAAEVWNVDFAASSLDVGDGNAALNGVQMTRIQDDALLVLRQLAGLPIKGRAARQGYQKRPARSFDLVILDPPRWARSRFGAVDVTRDYPSLFKPALLATSEGGRVLATNHLASVSLEEWSGILRRCAVKAGRPLRDVEILVPEADFPSFDGKPPLKIAICYT